MEGEWNFVYSGAGVDPSHHQDSKWLRSILEFIQIGSSFIMNLEFHGVETAWFILVDCDSLVVGEQKLKQYYLLGHHSYYLKWIHEWKNDSQFKIK